MKIKLTLAVLLLPTFVFAQSGQGNAGYQGTMSAKDGLGAAAPMSQAQGQGSSGNAGNQGTSSGLWGGTVPGFPVK